MTTNLILCENFGYKFSCMTLAIRIASALHLFILRWVIQQGYRCAYNAIRICQIINGLQVCQKQLQIIGWLLRKGFRFVVAKADAIVEKVREGFGYFKRKIKGELDLALQFELLNTDPVFGSTSNQAMVSGWSGQIIFQRTGYLTFRLANLTIATPTLAPVWIAILPIMTLLPMIKQHLKLR